MKLSDVQKIARKTGIKDSWRHSKPYLIKAIQRKEGNFDCFGSAKNVCDQANCLWRKDCLHK